MQKLLTANIHEFLRKVYLFEVSKGIYIVKVNDDWSLAMLFMRAQEFYENCDPKWQNQHYNIYEFIDWYKNSFKDDEHFTYGDDWQGFNIPSEKLESCMYNVDNHTTYDKIMLSIIKTIRKQHKDNFYLIGDDIPGYALEHEVAHGLYYTNNEYKKEMDFAISKLNKKVYTKFGYGLLDMGYAKSVIDDEIQAYTCTQLYPNRVVHKFDLNLKPFQKKNFNDFYNRCRDIYLRYYVKTEHYPIKIDYSEYF